MEDLRFQPQNYCLVITFTVAQFSRRPLHTRTFADNLFSPLQMEVQEQKPSPEPEAKPEPEVKSDPEPEQQHPSTVIMRRQVITTAGTIEDETKAEQPSPQEANLRASDASAEASPQNGTTPQPVQYQESNGAPEGPQRGAAAAFDQEHFTVATSEGYTDQSEYQGVSDEIHYTVAIQGHPHDLPIAGAHYDAAEDAKGHIIYTNLESVSSPYTSNQHYNANDATTYIQHHQYPGYQQHYTSRSPEDSPPSNLVHRNDPTLASSRVYPAVSRRNIQRRIVSIAASNEGTEVS